MGLRRTVNSQLLLYGVGAGEADSEGDASAAAFFLAVAFFLRGDGDGEAFVVAAVAVVEVAAVCCFWAQEAINATPIRTVIKDKTYFFIGYS